MVFINRIIQSVPYPLTGDNKKENDEKGMDKKKSTAYVVPHTHWDREWRYPIWKSRVLLIDFMDELIKTLEEDTAYNYFHLDGQVVIIEDYLEVRPGMKERLIQLVRKGRLGIGPFYTLPDLYPIDGECIIRNIKTGIELCKQFGGHATIGYHSFGWGQISQFPQIYADLGFEFLIAAKFVSKDRAPECEFFWEAPDRSKILVTRLGEHARANFYFNAYTLIKHGIDYFSDDFTYKWGKSKSALHDASPERKNQDYFTFEPSGNLFHEKYLKEGGEKAWDAYTETCFPETRLLMNGSDFTSCQPNLPEIIEKLNQAFSDIEFRISSLTEYFNDIKPHLAEKNLRVLTGELRDGSPADVSGNALTTRMYLKILNRKAQNLLIRKAEPLTSISCISGNEYPVHLFDKAWKYLLKAHAHDSINGVTQDKTADDVEYRLKQVTELAETLIERSAMYLAGKIDSRPFVFDDILLLCINTLPCKVKRVARVIIDIPVEKNIRDFSFVDGEGNTIEVQHLSRTEKTSAVFDPDSRSWPFYHHRHEVYLDAGELPPGGYKILRLVEGRKYNRTAEWWPLIDQTDGLNISQTPGRLENEHLLIEFEPVTGTFSITEKKTGNRFPGLHFFLDEGDHGDYWVYYPPYNNEIIDSRAGKQRVWTSENGPLAATLVVETILDVPAHGIRAAKKLAGEDKRSDDRGGLVIRSEFTLKKDDRKLCVRTIIKNTIEDHRLRLLFPTKINTDFASSAGHFTVDKRTIKSGQSPEGYFYPGMQTLPMQEFVSVYDRSRGIAILTNSIGEYELMSDPDRTLAFTLFRSVENKICSEFRASGHFPEQKGGQCLREMIFEYAIMPHQGYWHENEVCREAASLNASPVYYQFSPHKGRGLPAYSKSFYSVEPANIVLSALKIAEKDNSIIIRLFNPTDKSILATIKLAYPIDKVCRTNMLEEYKEAIDFSGNSFEFVFKKGKICTFRISLRR